jgi:glycine reductase
LPDTVSEANAIVSTGNSNATLMLPKMEIIIGQLPEIERVTGGNVDSIQPDGRLLVEIHGIMGSHNLQGNTMLSAMTI